MSHRKTNEQARIEGTGPFAPKRGTRVLPSEGQCSCYAQIILGDGSPFVLRCALSSQHETICRFELPG